MSMEINFDGLIGPSHNYAGLSFGNVASAFNKGAVSKPKAAALQGLAKMRLLMSLGVAQGVLPPHPRPHVQGLRALGFSGSAEEIAAACWRSDPLLFAHHFSASAMWTANAGTISPSADTADGRLHVSPANLAGNLHRLLEADFTHKMLATLFADEKHFTVHPPLPMARHYGDEGAANHGRLAGRDGAVAELFVYGENPDGRFPARQTLRASQAIARRHHVKNPLFIQQSNRTIDAGAFHNDVVGVANGNLLFLHEAAFADKDNAYAAIRKAVPDVMILEVAETDVPLQDAITSYLFNSQLVTLPEGSMALILPAEVRDTHSTCTYLDTLLRMNTPIKAIHIIDVRESMRNGGGPACLRLRVAVTEAERAALDQRFLLDDAKLAALEKVVQATYPDEIHADALGDPALHAQVRSATHAVYACLGLTALLDKTI